MVVRLCHVREAVSTGMVYLAHVPTQHQEADILTKPLKEVPFTNLVKLIMSQA